MAQPASLADSNGVQNIEMYRMRMKKQGEHCAAWPAI